MTPEILEQGLRNAKEWDLINRFKQAQEDDTMPIKCEQCGHIHWDEAPAMQDTVRAIKNVGRFTSRDVARLCGISIQAASNRIARLEQLGVVERVDQRSVNGGGSEKVWRCI